MNIIMNAITIMGQAVANCLNDSNLTAKQSLDSKVNLFKKFLNEQ